MTVGIIILSLYNLAHHKYCHSTKDFFNRHHVQMVSTIATLVAPVEEVVAAPVAAAADDKKGKKKK